MYKKREFSFKEMPKIKISVPSFLRVLRGKGLSYDMFLEKSLYHKSWLAARGRGKPISVDMFGEVCKILDCPPFDLLSAEEAANIEKYRDEFGRIHQMRESGLSWPNINKIRGWQNSKKLYLNMQIFFGSEEEYFAQAQPDSEKEAHDIGYDEALRKIFFRIYHERLLRKTWTEISSEVGVNALAFFRRNKPNFLRAAEAEYGVLQCLDCESPMPVDSGNARFCCQECRQKYNKKNKKPSVLPPSLTNYAYM